ncbi:MULTISPECIES: ABC-three component system protein [unclassified Acinetobacter]|uniref:ABC-three component system protein n=1 Tax=unclassified Acinetobacter TaxID=196816 RepID=UPI0015D32C66|nr:MULTISPECIES: ABC-three component system protein [unclassified Acinetobacter]
MSFDKHILGNIDGHGNFVLNGDGDIILNKVPEPKESIMFNLLTNIALMIANNDIKVEKPDNQPYEITDKIIFNEIKSYHDFQENYDDGMCIIEQRLRSIEDNDMGSIKPQIFRYVNSIFRRVKRTFPQYSSDQIIEQIEQKITEELKEYYKYTLSPEDLSHVEFVVYYVFAACKIFEKPSPQFMAQKNVNP